MKSHQVFFLLAVVFWIAETWWFGWNRFPLTRAEEVCDSIVWILFFAGVVAWISKRMVLVFVVESKTGVTISGVQRLTDD